MHPLMNIETGTVDDAWARLAALRELRAAMGALEDAGASLVGLVDDTTWRSDGVRALHELLEEMQRLASGHLFTLRAKTWELEGVAAG
ncbi:hypothetical protein [Microbacterium sp. EST19A]|uniref:hypothetical protein n=1 Tax=Microbacterium sp. EST19A TaxID=2862681 RepID=UPI001CC1261E|nr:hypothetical protein [Microbacterium sp. EST19A]